MTTLRLSVVLLCGLLVAGCQKPNPSAGAGAAPAKEAAKTAEEAAPAAQTRTIVETALRASRRAFKRADVKVTDEQLDGIVASGYEVFETTDEPAVRVFVFSYDAQELVKPAKVARWINRSGLIHNGQTSANGLRIIVAGTPEAGTLDEATIGAIDAFMDAFMMMR